MLGPTDQSGWIRSDHHAPQAASPCQTSNSFFILRCADCVGAENLGAQSVRALLSGRALLLRVRERRDRTASCTACDPARTGAVPARAPVSWSRPHRVITQGALERTVDIAACIQGSIPATASPQCRAVFARRRPTSPAAPTLTFARGARPRAIPVTARVSQVLAEPVTGPPKN